MTVDLLPDEEQQALVDTVRRVLSDTPVAADEGATVQRYATLGWLSVTVPEEQGGLGLGLAEEALVFREIGRALASPSLAALAAATHVAMFGQNWPLVQQLIGGAVTCAFGQPGPDEDVVLVWVTREPAFLVFVDAVQARSAVFDLSEVEAIGADEATLDPGYRLRRLWGRSLPPAPLVDTGPGSDSLLDRLHTLIAAELSGVAEQARDDSADYARQRQQFGRPIGSFQAVKHRCADMALRAEAAWSQTAFAALAVQADVVGAHFQAAAARWTAAKAATMNGRDNIQNHGGIGYTVENRAHLLLKRAHLLEQQGGAPRARIGPLLNAPRGL